MNEPALHASALGHYHAIAATINQGMEHDTERNADVLRGLRYMLAAGFVLEPSPWSEANTCTLYRGYAGTLITRAEIGDLGALIRQYGSLFPADPIAREDGTQ